MFIGARVAYIVNRQGRLGVVNRLNALDCSIVLDNNTEVAVPENNLTLVTNWKDNNKFLTYDEMKRLPDNTEALDIFLSTEAINFGVAALRACWLWGNANVFHNQLVMPNLIVNNSPKTTGLFTVKNKVASIYCSSQRLHSIRSVFTTVLHEMIHQYNYQIDMPAGLFDLKKHDPHGKQFLRWIPIINSIANVKITITHAGQHDDNDVNFVDSQNETEGKPYYFVCWKLQNYWVGVSLPNKEIFDKFISNFRDNHPSIRIFAGIGTNERAKKTLYWNTTGKISKKYTYLPEGIIKLLTKTAKSIPNYSLPIEVLNDN